MKAYKELTDDEKEKAKRYWLNHLLKGLIEGAIRFDDKSNKEKLQERIDSSLRKAERYRTPWFAAEIIMEDEITSKILAGMAEKDAEESFYTVQGETVVKWWELENEKN